MLLLNPTWEPLGLCELTHDVTSLSLCALVHIFPQTHRFNRLGIDSSPRIGSAEIVGNTDEGRLHAVAQVLP